MVGFGAAAHLITTDAVPPPTRTRTLRDRLQDRLLAAIPGAVVNGHPHRRLPGNLSLTLPGIEATDLLDRIPGIAASTGRPATPEAANRPTSSSRSASPETRPARPSGSASAAPPPTPTSTRPPTSSPA
ncbi:hypothetical protein ACQPXT_40580 [Streptomyces sp. CA-100214]